MAPEAGGKKKAGRSQTARNEPLERSEENEKEDENGEKEKERKQEEPGSRAPSALGAGARATAMAAMLANGDRGGSIRRPFDGRPHVSIGIIPTDAPIVHVAERTHRREHAMRRQRRGKGASRRPIAPWVAMRGDKRREARKRAGDVKVEKGEQRGGGVEA